MRCSAQAFCSSDRVRPTTSAPRFAASIASVPQPEPISSSRDPSPISSRSSSSRIFAKLRGFQRLLRRARTAPSCRSSSRRARPNRSRCRGRNAPRCSPSPAAASLSRARCARALIQRDGPLARPNSPSETALQLNSSNSGTGSGDVHSPSSHALYHPTEPGNGQPDQRHPALELQLRARSRSVKPEPGGASRRAGPCRSRPFRACWSMRPTRVAMPGANSRPIRPPPVVNPRSPMHQMSATRGSCGVSYEFEGAVVEVSGATAAGKRNERLARQPRVAGPRRSAHRRSKRGRCSERG